MQQEQRGEGMAREDGMATHDGLIRGEASN